MAGELGAVRACPGSPLPQGTRFFAFSLGVPSEAPWGDCKENLEGLEDRSPP